jgi:hypothetical protein
MLSPSIDWASITTLWVLMLVSIQTPKLIKYAFPNLFCKNSPSGNFPASSYEFKWIVWRLVLKSKMATLLYATYNVQINFAILMISQIKKIDFGVRKWKIICFTFRHQNVSPLSVKSWLTCKQVAFIFWLRHKVVRAWKNRN